MTGVQTCALPIYDGLQLAYKVTANSLYGQVGAPTSPIYMKELAASTTATGREMLEYSRDFIEGVFGNLINLVLDNEEKYIIESNKLYNGKNKILKTKYYEKSYPSLISWVVINSSNSSPILLLLRYQKSNSNS